MTLELRVYSNQKTWEEYKTDIENIRVANQSVSEKDAIAFAHTFCHSVVKYLWKFVDYRQKWECRELKFKKTQLDFKTLSLSKEIADYFISLNIMEYAYLLGNLYTMLLPDKYRSDNGIYYTPPTLAERLLDLLAAEGADWSKAHILDPACGGGAFLVTVANRVLGDYRIKNLSSEEKLTHLERHLAGIELDEFAGWITQNLLDIIVYAESIKAGRRLNPIIMINDTLQYATKEERKFDIVVGNPPYGKVKLDGDVRNVYSRSLYGHANLYGLFIDASLRLKKEKGLMGFVAPTSFLGGKYFSNLRNLLSKVAPPLAIDFVSMRNGVFEQVLQETCLTVFGKNATTTVMVNKINIKSSLFSVDRIGSFHVREGIGPWVIAREIAGAKVLEQLNATETTLKDYGYKVSTGQLVWNRMKEQIHQRKAQNVKPIIWAEAITVDGNFSFDYKHRKTKKYIKVNDQQKFLVCKEPVVLVQRTTAKEQERRLQSCVLPHTFIEKWNGVVVENHVNIIRPILAKPKISLEALSLLLNSQTVDKFFRCLSGSVAVSATELHAIPLPPVERLEALEKAIKLQLPQKLGSERIEEIVMEAYGLEKMNEL